MTGQLLLCGSFLLIGFALVLLVEGLLCAMFPNLIKRFLNQVTAMPEAILRSGGMVAAGVGCGLLFLTEGRLGVVAAWFLH